MSAAAKVVQRCRKRAVIGRGVVRGVVVVWCSSVEVEVFVGKVLVGVVSVVVVVVFVVLVYVVCVDLGVVVLVVAVVESS